MYKRHSKGNILASKCAINCNIHRFKLFAPKDFLGRWFWWLHVINTWLSQSSRPMTALIPFDHIDAYHCFNIFYVSLRNLKHCCLGCIVTWISTVPAGLLTHKVTWWHRSRSTLAQVMACCLMAPSYYLNQYWLIIKEVQWQSPEGNFTRDFTAIN